MKFNSYPHLEGMHSFLSPSQNAWLNYDDDKLRDRYFTRMAAAHGTRLHALANELILLKQNLPRSKKTLNAYVNDAIGFRMNPEQILFYSIECFGTADAIRYDPKKRELRIHDLKTGITKASMTQLRVYAAIFCLEYEVRPGDLAIILRIYQNDDVVEEVADVDDIARIMDRIVSADRYIQQLKAETSL